MHLSGMAKLKVIRAKTLAVGIGTSKSAFILVKVIDKEIVKIKASFLI